MFIKGCGNLILHHTTTSRGRLAVAVDVGIVHLTDVYLNTAVDLIQR